MRDGNMDSDHETTTNQGKRVGSSTAEKNDDTGNVMKRRRTKYVSRACNPCRRKKSRCNGERPTCAMCAVNNVDCTYDTAQDRRRPISKAYVTALENRVAWLESILEGRGVGEGVGETEEDIEARTLNSAGNSSLDRLLMRPNASQERIERLQIDSATGEVHEYGPTSVFKHFPANNASSSKPAQHKDYLSNSIATPVRNVAKLYLMDGFDEAMHEKTLHNFFLFFNPWCWWVDEAKFRNEMNRALTETDTATDRRASYYSPLLHFAILAIGVMHLESKSYSDRALMSDSFARNAVSFLEEEVEAAKPSSVIGLMLLGSHHAGRARQSLGWIYTGVGLRLTRILGLGVDTSSWVGMDLISAQDKQTRDRVWHTAYIQDKLWSTYVGRAPAPNLAHWRMPYPAIDGGEDARPWVDLENADAGQSQRSWVASTFTWTCKLSRIVELILINIYSTRRDAYSEKYQNIKFELCTLLEKWRTELPEALRVSPVMAQKQPKQVMLPHVLVMNIMFHFAVILLNRPTYCDTSRSPREMSQEMRANITTAAREQCHEAAGAIIRLAEVFDITYGLRHAPISMTQFTFTAGTIHLLGAANDKHIESNTALVKRCVEMLYTMGQTWKCAMQSGNILQRLLQEWHPKLGRSHEATKSNMLLSRNNNGDSTSSESSGVVDLQQNPGVGQQLLRPGWVSPDLNVVQSCPANSHRDLEYLLESSIYEQASHPDAAATYHPPMPPDMGKIDSSWISQPSVWADNCYSSTPTSTHEQSLLGMLMGYSGAAPGAWSQRLFNGDSAASSL